MLKTIFLCMGKFNTYVFMIQDVFAKHDKEPQWDHFFGTV